MARTTPRSRPPLGTSSSEQRRERSESTVIGQRAGLAPSLLSIPYLCDRESYDSAVWEATRRMVLSKDGNPWFFSGAKGEGVGSPHTGYHRIWPMSIAMRTLVSRDKAEMAGCISALLKTTGGKGAMHESFDVNDDRRFSRGWFAWADGLFAEAVIHAHKAGALW